MSATFRFLFVLGQPLLSFLWGVYIFSHSLSLFITLMLFFRLLDDFITSSRLLPLVKLILLLLGELAVLLRRMPAEIYSCSASLCLLQGRNVSCALSLTPIPTLNIWIYINQSRSRFPEAASHLIRVIPNKTNCSLS